MEYETSTSSSGMEEEASQEVGLLAHVFTELANTWLEQNARSILSDMIEKKPVPKRRLNRSNAVVTESYVKNS